MGDDSTCAPGRHQPARPHVLAHLAAVEGPRRVVVADFLARNHLFFLNLGDGGGESLTEWASSVEGSSIVTSMARNGTTFGIRLAGRDPVVHRALRRRSSTPSTTPVTAPRTAPPTSATAPSSSSSASAAPPPPARRRSPPSSAAAWPTLSPPPRRWTESAPASGSRIRLPHRLPRHPARRRRPPRRRARHHPHITTGILHASAGVGQIGASVGRGPAQRFLAALAAR